MRHRLIVVVVRTIVIAAIPSNKAKATPEKRSFKKAVEENMGFNRGV